MFFLDVEFEVHGAWAGGGDAELDGWMSDLIHVVQDEPMGNRGNAYAV